MKYIKINKQLAGAMHMVWCFALMISLFSCQQELADVSGEAGDRMVTFNLAIEQSIKTRTDGQPTRYVMEQYTGGEVTGDAVVRQEQDNASFKVLLKNGTTYTFLFWADYGTAGGDVNDYEVSDLKAARVSLGQTPAKAAFSGSTSFVAGQESAADYAVTLTHAVAQVNFVQSIPFTRSDNTLKVSFSEVYSLNVADRSITPINQVVPEYTFESIEQVSANTVIGTSYIVARNYVENEAKTLLALTTDLNNGETVHTIDNVPFARNQRTTITGAYSKLYGLPLVVSCSDEWSDDIDADLKGASMYFTIDLTGYSNSYTLPFINSGTTGDYELNIDWGDGSELTTIAAGTDLSTAISHTYATADRKSVV